MHSLEQRLRRVERMADVADPHAWMRGATDEELETAFCENHARFQKLADEYGMTVHEVLMLAGSTEDEAARHVRLFDEYPWKTTGAVRANDRVLE